MKADKCALYPPGALQIGRTISAGKEVRFLLRLSGFGTLQPTSRIGLLTGNAVAGHHFAHQHLIASLLGVDSSGVAPCRGRYGAFTRMKLHTDMRHFAQVLRIKRINEMRALRTFDSEIDWPFGAVNLQKMSAEVKKAKDKLKSILPA